MYTSKNNKFITITVVTGIALIIWQLLVGPLGYRFQLLFFIVSLFTLGIPHGAFDYSVEQEVFRRHKNLFRGFVFRLNYLAAVVVYAVCWYLFPQLSLVAFLLMSSWHFGFKLKSNNYKLSTYTN